MFQVFSKAAQGANLSPAARAFLRLLEGFVMAALVTAAPLVAQYLAGHSLATLDLAATARYAVALVALAFLIAALKHAKAHMDAPLAAMVDSAAQPMEAAIEEWGGVPNDTKIEPPDVTAPAPETAPAA
jgi:hypothetical protein